MEIPFFDLYLKEDGMTGHDELKIRTEIAQVSPNFQWLTLKGNLTDELPAFPGNVLIGMANNMTLPIDWNVEFQAETAAGETRSLYVHRYILSARSEYYKTSLRTP
jgi:hypothetical protein